MQHVWTLKDIRLKTLHPENFTMDLEHKGEHVQLTFDNETFLQEFACQLLKNKASVRTSSTRRHRPANMAASSAVATMGTVGVLGSILTTVNGQISKANDASTSEQAEKEIQQLQESSFWEQALPAVKTVGAVAAVVGLGALVYKWWNKKDSADADLEAELDEAVKRLRGQLSSPPLQGGYRMT